MPIISWPDDQETRRQLARAGQPRILVLGRHAVPPEDWDDLEDWVREPLDHQEVSYRAHTLLERYRYRTRKIMLDDDGLLTFEGRWVALTPPQVALTSVLIARVGRVVPRDDLEDVFRAAGGSASQAAFDSCIKRLRTRLVEVGLDLHRLSSARFLLEIPTNPR